MHPIKREPVKFSYSPEEIKNVDYLKTRPELEILNVFNIKINDDRTQSSIIQLIQKKYGYHYFDFLFER